MPTPFRYGALLLLAFPPAVIDAQGSALRLIDSIRIAESDTFLLSRPNRIHAGVKGRYFILDTRESRVTEVATDGRLIRRLGRRGSGPGEFQRPSALASSGDSLLGVYDSGLRRATLHDLRTGGVRTSISLGGWFPQIRLDGAVLRAAVLEPESTTAVINFTAMGTRRVGEGVIPSIFRRSPLLMGGFGGVFFADDGDDTYAFFEVSNDLYHWQRDARIGDMTTIPGVTRKGVRVELFDEILRDPSKAAAIAYDRSLVVALERIGPGRLALVTLDGVLEQGANFVGTLRLSVLDLTRRRACADQTIPAATEPMAAVGFRADTLVVLQQGETAAGDPGTWITRYAIDDRRCSWLPLSSAVPAR